MIGAYLSYLNPNLNLNLDLNLFVILIVEDEDENDYDDEHEHEKNCIRLIWVHMSQPDHNTPAGARKPKN